MRELIAALAGLTAVLCAGVGGLAFVWVGVMFYADGPDPLLPEFLATAIIATVVAVGSFALRRSLRAGGGGGGGTSARASRKELDAVIRILTRSLSVQSVLPELQKSGFSGFEQSRLGIMAQGRAGWLSFSVNPAGQIYSAVYAPGSGGEHATIVEAQVGGHGKLVMSAG